MVIGKCTDVFRGICLVGGGWGWGLGATWKDLSLEEFVMGEKEFHEEGGGFSRIIEKNYKNKYEKVF